MLAGGAVDAEFKERLTLLGGACAELGVDNLLAELQLLHARLPLARPVAGVVGQEIFVGVDIEHAAGVAPQRHGFLLLMADLAPGLDDVLLGVSHIVQHHLVGVFVVGKPDDGLGAAVDRLLFAAFIIQISREVTVGMGDGQRGLKRVLTAGTGIGLAAADAVGAVGTRLNPPVEMTEVGLSGGVEFVAEVDLIQATVVAHLQHEVDVVGTDADVLFVSRLHVQCQDERGEQ